MRAFLRNGAQLLVVGSHCWVSSDPSVKGTSRKRAAPYVER
jgi:hypothetical protein